MKINEEILTRLRNRLAAHKRVDERRMMGSICFMLDGVMACGTSGNGLMVRVGQDRYSDALKVAGVKPLTIGKRRPKGFVIVQHADTLDDATFDGWLQQGIDFALHKAKGSATHGD